MKELLKAISAKALVLADFDFPEEIKTSQWLGTESATQAEIEETEKRLEIELPEDYKQFLLLTNGFTAPMGTEPTFETVDEIDYLKNIDEYGLIEAFSVEGIEDVGEKLQRSILIGGKDEEQQFLIIPPKDKDDHWIYWKFADWLPGEEPYDGLDHYFQEVSVFINEELESEEEE